jgi:hypothetical protein
MSITYTRQAYITNSDPTDPNLLYAAALIYRAIGGPIAVKANLLFFRAALKNHAPSAYEMYRLHANSDKKYAISWLNTAVTLGHAQATFQLACLYQIGSDVPKDPQKATLLYEQAAKLGEIASYVLLGKKYEAGDGVEQDFQKAAICYQKGHDNGFVLASQELAFLYEKGLGVEKNLGKSIDIMQQATNQLISLNNTLK